MMATKACLSVLMQHYVKSTALLFVSKSIILSSTEKDRGCQQQNPIMPVTLCYQGVKTLENSIFESMVYGWAMIAPREQLLFIQDKHMLFRITNEALKACIPMFKTTLHYMSRKSGRPL